MFRRQVNISKRKLDLGGEIALADLMKHQVGSPEYEKAMTYIIQLQRIRESEYKTGSVSKDTMAIILANILGILIIIKAEHLNVVNSKAIGLLLKPFTKV